MSKMIPAGIVTAYGAAVRGGYLGTYEEFCAALGDLARVLEEFEGFSVEVETLEPGSSATASYSDGVLALGIPKGDTGNGIASAELNENYTLTLTWTNGESETVGPIRGAVGATPDFSIGTVTTGAAGSSAEASITGTPEEPVLNLTIPKGDPGEVPAAAIAPTEASTTASQAYAIGDYFWLSGTLYEATAAITQGGTIVVGTNCKTAEIGETLTQQKNAIEQKQTAPSSAGTAGQVLGLDDQLQPVWVDQTGGGGDVSACAPVIINTASGDIASFPDGADDMPIKKVVGTIVPVQSGTGDPSPDNVRPISGWTGANIYQAGLPKGYTYANYITVNNSIIIPTNIDFNAHDIEIICVHQPVVYSQYGPIYTVYKGETYNATRLILNTALGTYLFNNATRANAPGSFSESELSFIKTVNRFGSIDVNDRTITVGTTAGSDTDVTTFRCSGLNMSVRYKYIIVKKTDASGGQRLLVLVACRNADGIAGFYDLVNGTFWTTASSSDITATGDAPSDLSVLYNVTLPINWQTEAGTIYGGTVTLNEDGSVDVVSDMGLDTKSSSDIALRILNSGSSGYNIYRLRMPVEYGNVLISNQYKQYPSVNDAIAAGGGIAIGNKTGSNLYISVVFPWVSGDTNETADARLLANTLQIGYTLATPQTYPFDNIGQLYTYLGTNNVWIDTGAITECDYPADTKLYIDGKLAEIQATILENIGG